MQFTENKEQENRNRSSRFFCSCFPVPHSWPISSMRMICVIGMLYIIFHLGGMISQQKEIENLEDVKLLVNTFYGKVREDDLLKNIFEDTIQDRWPMHLEKMYRFWQTVLLEEYTYSGAPFPPHLKLPVEEEHFKRWIKLFFETVDDLFTGERAERAREQGNRMAIIFLSKIQHLRNNNLTPAV